MDRLTKKIGDTVAFPEEIISVTVMLPANEYMNRLLTRLAAYEDTGLEPEELHAAKAALGGDRDA